jgi:hypothetical protein
MVIGVNTAMRETFAGGPLSGDFLPAWYGELSRFDYQREREAWWAMVNSEERAIYGF